jgi:hypothetical protein
VAEDRTLPAEIRHRLISVAADVIGNRPIAELPAGVRRFARFAPAQRLRLGSAEIAASLAADERFRESVAAEVSVASPELVEQVRTGTVSAAADPAEIGLIAYLIRPEGWRDTLDAAAAALALASEQKNAGADLARLRSEVDQLRSVNAELVKSRDATRAALKTATAEQARELAELQRRWRTSEAELRGGATG